MCSKDSLNFKKDTRGETMSVYEKKSGARAKGSSKGHRLLALILSCAMALSVNAPAMTAFAVNNDSNIIVYDDEPSTSSNQKSKSSAGNTSDSNVVVYDDGEKPNTGTSTGSSSGKSNTKTTTDHQSGLVTSEHGARLCGGAAPKEYCWGATSGPRRRGNAPRTLLSGLAAVVAMTPAGAEIFLILAKLFPSLI